MRQGNAHSAATYRERVQPTLAASQQRVLDVIRHYPNGISMKGVAVILGVGLHTVSGRRGELVAAGLIVSTGKYQDRSEMFRAVVKHEQMSLLEVA